MTLSKQSAFGRSIDCRRVRGAKPGHGASGSNAVAGSG